MFRKKTLPNGLTLLTEDMPEVRSAAVGVWIRRGSRHESASESGLAHFIEHMVFKGTERRTQARIAQEMDEIGGQTDAFTSHEYAGFHATVLGEDLPRAFDLLSDIVLAPSFDEEELEREQMVIFEEIKGVEDSPEELVHELFTAKFWPDHALGRPILGTPETVGAFTRDDLVRFFRRTYLPSNLVVSVAGNLDHDAVASLASTHFGRLEGPQDGLRDVPPTTAASIRFQDKELEQAHLVVGAPAPKAASEDRFAAQVLNAVLGGTLSSRLFQSIREERGLAYAVYSGVDSYHDCGQFTVYAGTDPKNVPEVLDLTLVELGRVKSELVEEDELRRAKAHLKGGMLLSLESTGSRMSRAARQEIYYGRHVDVDAALGALEAVTAESVRRVANDMFGEGALAMTLLGPSDHVDPRPETLVA